MLLYNTKNGPIVAQNDQYFPVTSHTFDELLTKDDIANILAEAINSASPLPGPPADEDILAPLGSQQELWASGVTYHPSRSARVAESKEAGGGSFYDRVFEAPRPELFFKATPARTVAPNQPMHLRSDSKWIVPEPELTLVITPNANIIGYTAGNDLSCRDIEGENPLYLPQAKTFDRCAAVGPALFITNNPIDPEPEISLEITRDGQTVFSGSTPISRMKRTGPELVQYLTRETTFPYGCLLMTGTGIIPPDDFCLQRTDTVHITIPPVPTLVNPMND